MNLTIRKYTGRKRKNPFFKYVRAIIVLFFTACLGVAVYGLVEDTFPADVAVVLGNEVQASGECSPRLKARLDRALELYEDRLAQKIIVSGGTGRSGYDEAEAMRDYLVGKGVPENSIVMDKNGVNTRMTAKFTARYMEENGYNKVLAVSQYFHLLRVKMALKAEGISTVGTARPLYFELRDLYSLAREIPALILYKAGIRD